MVVTINGIPFVVIPYEELLSMGLVMNPNMYIGSGFLFCPHCNNYHYHFAMSHAGQSDCFELCKNCNSYVAPKTTAVLKGLITNGQR